jgi:trans-2,3-dihydro-3-hydroxyanthranilate isomerase
MEKAVLREIRLVDAFTEHPFGGNPAGVVLEAAGLSDEMMQKIAREVNVSETAFVRPDPSGEAEFEVRFFTPHTEVDLCGHATVATFWTLAAEGVIERRARTTIYSQRTRAGILPVEIHYLGDALSHIMMEQAAPQFRETSIDPGRMAEILGIKPEEIDRTHLPIELAFTGIWCLKVPVKHRKALEAIRLDRHALVDLGFSLEFETCCVFCLDPVRDDAKVHQRVFCPQVGVDEDPATGTASGSLGAYLAKHAVIEPGEDGCSFVIEQGCEMGRPGHIQVEVFREHGQLSVLVGGSAVEVLKGTIRCTD